MTSSGYRVAENQIFGAVFLSREQNPELRDQTNREGLFFNKAFRDMRLFILDGLRYLERERTSREQRTSLLVADRLINIDDALNNSQHELSKLVSDLRSTVEVIPETLFHGHEENTRLSNIVTRFQEFSSDFATTRTALSQKQTEQQNERQLLLGLATIGIAMAAFGHETTGAIMGMLNRATLLQKSVEKLPENNRIQMQNDLAVLSKAVERVGLWGTFALDRIHRDKRTRKDVDLNTIIHRILQPLSDTLGEQKIEVETQCLAPNLPLLKAFEMDIEAIVVNLITNSVHALRASPTKKLHVETKFSIERGGFLLTVADSGHGIPDDDVPKIFKPLFSTRVDANGDAIGTGMGLKIVKDIVDDFRGKITVKGCSDIGGAEFEVFIPAQERP